jgi:hypothetical protein
MKPCKIVVVAAAAAFAFSLFLPAFGPNSGLFCLEYCFGTLTRLFLASSDWYFSGFAVANVIFVVLVGAIFAPARFTRLRLWASVIVLLQVFSWFFVNPVHSEVKASVLSPEGVPLPFTFDQSLGMGYFIWLFSYVLLVCAHIILRNEPGQHSPDPAPASCAAH